MNNPANYTDPTGWSGQLLARQEYKEYLERTDTPTVEIENWSCTQNNLLDYKACLMGHDVPETVAVGMADRYFGGPAIRPDKLAEVQIGTAKAAPFVKPAFHATMFFVSVMTGNFGEAGALATLGSAGLRYQVPFTTTGALEFGATTSTGVSVFETTVNTGLPGFGETSSTARRGIWSLGAGPRGYKIEDLVEEAGILEGDRLPTNFRRIDWFSRATGVATSLKSMDLAGTSYQTSAGILNAGTGYVDKVANFESGALSGYVIRKGAVTARQLYLAIPPGTISGEQRLGLQLLQQYTNEQGVTLRIFTVE